jgi:hypothetical protein
VRGQLLLGSGLHQGNFSHSIDPYCFRQAPLALRSRFNQAETALDSIETGIDAIDANGHVGNLHFQRPEALHHFKLTLVNDVNTLADVSQVLKNDIVRFSHARILA